MKRILSSILISLIVRLQLKVKNLWFAENMAKKFLMNGYCVFMMVMIWNTITSDRCFCFNSCSLLSICGYITKETQRKNRLHLYGWRNLTTLGTLYEITRIVILYRSFSRQYNEVHWPKWLYIIIIIAWVSYFCAFLLFCPAPLFCKQLKKYGKFYLEFHYCSYICEQRVSNGGEKLYGARRADRSLCQSNGAPGTDGYSAFFGIAGKLLFWWYTRSSAYC